MTRRVVSFAGQAVLWAVLVALLAVLLAGVAVPRVAGAATYSVRTGSMEPTYPVGTLVVVRPTPAEELRVGDVITYQVESGRPLVATHRIHEIAVTLAGERRIRTRGDANDAVDPEPVREVQVTGKVWYAMPYLGHLNAMFSGTTRNYVLVAVAGGLVLYAAVMFVGAARDRLARSRRRPAGGDPHPVPEEESAR